MNWDRITAGQRSTNAPTHSPTHSPTHAAEEERILTWLATVVAAYALERAGARGPAETVLRRLVYRDTR